MALRRRNPGSVEGTVWPGFVDSMTSLLLVLMFVLTIFVVVQFVLRDTISGQASQLTQLTAQVQNLTDALGLSEDRAEGLERDVSGLNADLLAAAERDSAQAALISRLTSDRDADRAALADADLRITGFETQVAGLLAERSESEARIAGLEGQQERLMSEAEALNLALASARDEISEGAEAARLAAARAEAMQALINSLEDEADNQQAALDAAEEQRILDVAAAEALRDRLKDADAELTAMTLSLEEQRRAAEETLTLLAAADAARQDLDLRLVAALAAATALEDRLAGAESEQQSVLARLTAALAAQQVAEAEARRIAGALGSGAEAAAAAQADLAARLEATEGRIAALTAELAAANARVQDLDRDLTSVSSGQDAVAAELAEAAERIAMLTDERDRLAADLAAALAVSSVAQEDLEALRSALDEALDGAGVAAAEASERLTAALADQRATEAERQRLENELAAAVLAREERAAAEAAERAGLEERLALAVLARESAESRLSAAELDRDDQAELERQLAEALSAVASARSEGAAEGDRQAALLAVANQRLTEEEALSADSLREVQALNEQVSRLRSEVAGLQQLLNLADAADSEADVQIESLTTQLNTALARAAAEERRARLLEAAEAARLQAETERLAAEAQDLERYRSEFFGELRQVVDGQDRIRIEGDRFVFSSEVLFAPGSAILSEAGQAELSQVAGILRQIADGIPPGIDWIIRVDGHTDNVPLSGLGEFRDNWDLSQARAASVVRYMVEAEGIPPNRLSANGFGEFQPLAAGDSPEARAMNRRIELKLTER